MNILILVSSLDVGGAEKQAVNDANMFCDKNNTHLLVFSGGMLKDKLSAKVKYLIIKKSGYLETSKRIANYIIENKIEIIHASLFAPMIIGALASLRTKIPIFWTFHSHEYDIPIKSKIAFILLSRYKRLKNIFYVNNELMHFFEERLKLPTKKSMILYNSTDLKLSKENGRGLNKEIIRIGYVGRLVELKRVHFLLELAIFLKENKISNFSVDIYGDGESRKELENLSLKYKLKDVVVFHGFTADLEQAYNTFDIFVNPSREECLSIATIDAGIMGKPKIVFDVGGNNEIVIHNKTGFVINTKKELFKKTEELLLDSKKRTSFGKNAIYHCESNFSKEIRKNTLTKYFLNALKS